jgi:hypothetical protein
MIKNGSSGLRWQARRNADGVTGGYVVPATQPQPQAETHFHHMPSAGDRWWSVLRRFAAPWYYVHKSVWLVENSTFQTLGLWNPTQRTA